MIPVLGVNCSFKRHVTFNDVIIIKPFIKDFNGIDPDKRIKIK